MAAIGRSLQDAIMVDEAKPRRRAQNRWIGTSREARRVVAPAQEFLDTSYRELALIRVALSLRSEHRQALVKRALEQVPLAVAQRIELEQRAAEATADVASHSLIRDVRKALVRLKDELERAGDSLDDAAEINLQFDRLIFGEARDSP